MTLIDLVLSQVDHDQYESLSKHVITGFLENMASYAALVSEFSFKWR